jgi:hypothetical protein
LRQKTPAETETDGYDEAGNYWCRDCQEKQEFMRLGAYRGYPEVAERIKDEKGNTRQGRVLTPPGIQNWARYARLLSFWDVETALFFLKGGVKAQSPRKQEETGAQEEERTGPTPAHAPDAALWQEKRDRLQAADPDAAETIQAFRSSRSSLIYHGKLLGPTMLPDALMDDLLTGGQAASEAQSWMQEKIQLIRKYERRPKEVRPQPSEPCKEP